MRCRDWRGGFIAAALFLAAGLTFAADSQVTRRDSVPRLLRAVEFGDYGSAVVGFGDLNGDGQTEVVHQDPKSLLTILEGKSGKQVFFINRNDSAPGGSRNVLEVFYSKSGEVLWDNSKQKDEDQDGWVTQGVTVENWTGNPNENFVALNRLRQAHRLLWRRARRNPGLRRERALHLYERRPARKARVVQ